MDDKPDAGMDPQAALTQAQRVGDRVRRQGRWHGWMWLLLAAMTPAFFITMQSEAIASPVGLWIAIVFGATTLVLVVVESRRGVWGRQASRVDRAATQIFMGTVMLVVAFTFPFDTYGPPGWFVALAFVPSLPCLAAAWKVLRS